MEQAKDRLVIIGASGHGKVAADIALLCGYQDIVFLDDDEKVKECAGFPVLGNISQADHFKGDVFVAIGNTEIRERLSKRFECISLIHPNAVIGRNVLIGKGSIVMAGVVINSDATIGNHCIINTSASVDHDCQIGDYSHVAVGSHLCGTVHIGNKVWIGAGATVINNVMICDNCVIGAGATVVNDIFLPGKYVGVPAKIITNTET